MPRSIEWKYSNGLVPYEEAIAFMEARVAAIIAGTALECIWCLEHPPLYTAGTSATSKDLLQPNRFPVYSVGRGGQYTYHGPGQRMVYVMLDLKERVGQDVRQFVFLLEQWIINVLRHYGIEGERRKGRIGIWVETQKTESKIAAIGIRLKRWVSYHGFVINVNPDLEHFLGIVPCGILEYGVTSMEQLGVQTMLQEINPILKEQCPF